MKWRRTNENLKLKKANDDYIKKEKLKIRAKRMNAEEIELKMKLKLQ